MCVLFKTDVIIKNTVFAIQESISPNILKYDLVRKFCETLYSRITENESPRYKYVLFDVDDERLEDFCRKESERYIDLGDSLYFRTQVQSDEIAQINFYFDEHLKHSLEYTRKIIAKG